jgi:hypothetical protein
MPADAKQQEDLYLSYYSWCVRDRAAKDPFWAQQRQWIQPNAACRSEAAIGRDLRTLRRRDRLTAGHIALAFLKETESGAMPVLPKGAKRLSLNQMIETMDPDVLAKMIYRAGLYEPLLERGRLKIAPDSLIRFRFAPTGVKTNPVS